MHSGLLLVACLAGCSLLPELALGSCDDDKCSSIGDDCCAPREIGEVQTCRDFYEAHDLGQPCAGYMSGTYTCCERGSEPPPGAVASQGLEDGCEAKCTSLYDDCCAPFGEQRTCPFGKKAKVVGECGGDPNGMYVCCDDVGTVVATIVAVLVLLGGGIVVCFCMYRCFCRRKPAQQPVQVGQPASGTVPPVEGRVVVVGKVVEPIPA